MSKREYRRFTAEQKIEVLKQAEQPGVSISEVCRKHRISPAQFYRWRAVAQNGSAAALKNEARGVKPASQSELDRRDAELARLRAVVAEITAENLELKKKI